MTHIARLYGLRSLQLNGTGISDDGVRHVLQLPALSSLGLQGNRLSTRLLRNVAQMPSLQELWCSVDRESADTLSRPGLSVLWGGNLSDEDF